MVQIEIEPKADGMHHVNFLFSDVAPDPEDAWVRDGLTAFSVPPKRILAWEREGAQLEVWQYGECVIGEALYYIDRYKRVVDRIRTLCQAELDQAPAARTDMYELIAETGHEFEQQARLTMGVDGAMTFSVDDSALRARVLDRLSDLNPDTSASAAN